MALVKFLNFLYSAVGILCFLQKYFVKLLEYSKIEAFLFGPKAFIFILLSLSKYHLLRDLQDLQLQNQFFLFL